MNKFPRILSLLLVALLLASCGADPGEEPAALQAETQTGSATEAGPTEAPALQPADDMREAVPVQPDEDEAALLPESQEAVESELVEPVVVDLAKLTPAPTVSGGEPREMPKPGVPDPLIPLVTTVSQDLASRLDIDIGEITLVETEAIDWRDSSLGCPEPGQMYLMVITPGYRIVLEANDKPYEYHTDNQDNFVYCENPEPGSGSVRVDE
jgi:hypothetical protein